MNTLNSSTAGSHPAAIEQMNNGLSTSAVIIALNISLSFFTTLLGN